MFSLLSKTQTETETPLYQVWAELNKTVVPSLSEQKTYVYNKIQNCMNSKKNTCTIPLNKVTNEEELINWLEQVHKVDACVGDKEHDDGSITKYLVVSW